MHKNELHIRRSTLTDLPEIKKIYAHARLIMQQNANPQQWGNNYPSTAILEHDILTGIGRVVVTKDGSLCGAFAFATGPDPTYLHILEGAWLSTDPYSVIHRLASNGKEHGIFQAVFDYCEDLSSNIRVDTHQANQIMQKLLIARAYTYCGIIHVADGSPRLAYQKILPKQRVFKCLD